MRFHEMQLSSLRLTGQPCTGQAIRKKAAIYCDAEAPLIGCAISVATDILVARAMQDKGVWCNALGDYSPNEMEGANLDRAVYKRLDDCLHSESAIEPDRFYAPLAYHQILMRLSRYLWIKACVARFLDHHGVTALVVTSSKDADLVRAALTVGGERGIAVELLNGSYATPSNVIHTLGPYGLPKFSDPELFVRLRFSINRLLGSNRKPVDVLSDSLVENPNGIDVGHFRIRREIAVLSALSEKLRSLFGKQREIVTPTETWGTFSLRAPTWNLHFERDECGVIAATLTFFFRNFRPAMLRKLARNISLYLATTKPKLIVLSHDRVDLLRLVTRCAKAAGIPVAYFPHGIVWEDYSGERTLSPFSPDMVFAWSPESRDAFTSLGWRAWVMRFPRYQLPSVKFRAPPQLSQCRILYLAPEWAAATQAGREDCFLRDIVEVVESFDKLGLQRSQIHIKYHAGPQANVVVKELALARLRESFGELISISSHVDTLSIIHEYDIILTTLTSGIFEAVIRGVPVVVFGLSQSRVGALAKYDIPHAGTGAELVQVLQELDHNKLAIAYRNLVSSLQSNTSMADVFEAI